MSCYHPNIMGYFPEGFPITYREGIVVFPKNKDGSLKKWKFYGAGYEVEKDGVLGYEYTRRFADGTTKVSFVPKDYPLAVDSNGEYPYSLMVPCQQCLGCRIDYSKHWADRIVMEQLMSPPNSCFFVTFTYDEEHLQECLTGKAFEYVVDGQDVMLAGATLVKKHFQDFVKRLRSFYADNYNHQGIRYFVAGEYGSLTRRPHYHVCFFNLPIPDLELFSNNFRGDALYNSPTLERIWGKGYVVIGELNWETAAYTARYVVKKFKGKESEQFYESVGGVLPEFCLSSRRPGIAGAYFDKEVEKIYREDAIQLPSTKDRDGRTSVPRYFDKLLEKYISENPDTELNLEKIKAERRQLGEERTYNRRILTGLFDKEYFKFKEESFRKSVSILSRKNIDKSLDI